MPPLTHTHTHTHTHPFRPRRPLGGDSILQRDGPGGQKVEYISAADQFGMVNLAFGFNGCGNTHTHTHTHTHTYTLKHFPSHITSSRWHSSSATLSRVVTLSSLISFATGERGTRRWSTEIKDFTVDYSDRDKKGSWDVGVAAVVRVSLPDGSFHEDVGYGDAKGPSRSQVFGNARYGLHCRLSLCTHTHARAHTHTHTHTHTCPCFHVAEQRRGTFRSCSRAYERANLRRSPCARTSAVLQEGCSDRCHKTSCATLWSGRWALRR
jgi:hypothetical protein